MKERPILFSASMCRALLAGTKTQTRRVCKLDYRESMPEPEYQSLLACCPYGKPGDRIYVRENAWQRPDRTQKMMREGADTWPTFIYDADYGPGGIPWVERDDLKTWGWKRRPSIHLPRAGSRILLEIVAVRIERLQDISEADAIAEGIQQATDERGGPHLSRETGQPLYERHGPIGCPIGYHASATGSYSELWRSINGRDSWDANPFVWVIEFNRVTP